MKELTAIESKQMMDMDNTIIIDVREQEEYAAERIAGAVFMPLSNFADKIMAFDTQGKKIIFYCRGGVRSAKACDLVRNIFGDDNIYNMSGGIEGWKASGLKTEK